MLRDRISTEDREVLDALIVEWPVTEAHAALIDWLGDQCDVSYAVLAGHAAGRCRCPRMPAKEAL